VPERNWLVYFKVGLIVAIAGGLLEVIGDITSLGFLGWALGIAYRHVPRGAQVTIAMPPIIPMLFICSLLFDAVVLMLSVSLYGKWGQIKTREVAEEVYSQLIILIIIAVLALNIIALVGAVIAVYGVLSGFPGLKFRFPTSRPPKEEASRPISPSEAYERLLVTYRGVYGAGIADKLLKGEIEKLMRGGLSEEEAVMALYEKVFSLRSPHPKANVS